MNAILAGKEIFIEQVIITGLRKANQSASQFYYLMQELKRLVETAGGEVVQEIRQTRPSPDPATMMGSGKILEIGEAAQAAGIKTVVFNDDLSPAQQKNIEKQIPAKIVDRARLILDIFAGRARSREGQLQVELAQLTYLVPRLTGAWRGYSQQVGGIGTRGPGERKIEVERRYVRERIKHLKKEIEEIRNHRTRARLSRQMVPIPQIALVGYTNVGKSTLLNALVGKNKGVYADDKLFATLDPTTRRVKLPHGQRVLFTDTVGFIQSLPPFLVTAFRATLEEVTQATLLVHVTDLRADNPIDQQKNVVETLKSLGADSLPTLTVHNKLDAVGPARKEAIKREGALALSSITKEGIPEFLEAVEKKLDERLVEVTFELPYQNRNLLSHIYRTGHIISEKPTEGGTALCIRIDPSNWKKISHQLSQTKHE